MISQMHAGPAWDIGFARKSSQERGIDDYGRLKKYASWDQETSESSANW